MQSKGKRKIVSTSELEAEIRRRTIKHTDSCALLIAPPHFAIPSDTLKKNIHEETHNESDFADNESSGSSCSLDGKADEFDIKTFSGYHIKMPN